MICRDGTFLDKSFGDWANVKVPAIVPAEVIYTIGDNDAVDVPNLIPPDHGPNDKRMIDDDDICQGNYFQIPVLSNLKHGNYISDDEDSDDHALQGSNIQMDLKGYNAVADKNEVNEQPRSETAANPKY